MKIGTLSDLHIDRNEIVFNDAVNIVWDTVKESGIDKLFIAGDTSKNYKESIAFADKLTALGVDTYTLFGNHEFESISYKDRRNLANECYISNKAIPLNEDTVVLAIDGFADHSFVLENDNEIAKRMPRDKKYTTRIYYKDNIVNNEFIKELEEIFNSTLNSLTRMLEDNKDKNIIIMTHYIPSEHFLLFKEDDDFWNAQNAFMGSKRFGELAEKYKVNKFIFGHTHYAINERVNGVSYHCNPVGYITKGNINEFKERVEDMYQVFEF